MSSATDQKIPLPRMRRAVVRAMVASAAIPQFTLQRDVATAALEQIRARFGTDDRVSLTDQLVAAASRGLAAHPRLNSTYDADDVAVIELSSINVGLAIAVPDGLITAPILDSDGLSLPELARARRAGTEAVRQRTIDAASLAKVTFTISNLGPFGIDRFTALVVPPQAAILAVGAATDGRLCLSLSCDHRAVDGAPAAEFLRDVVQSLEEPEWMERHRR